jgi:hypothetical protein
VIAAGLSWRSLLGTLDTCCERAVSRGSSLPPPSAIRFRQNLSKTRSERFAKPLDATTAKSVYSIDYKTQNGNIGADILA